MRVLLDESLPRKLKFELPDHDVATVPEMGWDKEQRVASLGRSKFPGLCHGGSEFAISAESEICQISNRSVGCTEQSAGNASPADASSAHGTRKHSSGRCR